MTDNLRKCSECPADNCYKPIAEFSKDAKGEGGLKRKCKDCFKKKRAKNGPKVVKMALPAAPVLPDSIAWSVWLQFHVQALLHAGC
jgi:hypothetical protein